MSAAYLDSSHDNTIPMKQPLKITLELTQQETGEHKPSVSPSFLTNNSSALWGCVPCLAHPAVPLLQECGKDGGSEMLPISSGALQASEGTVAVWKIRHVICTEDTFRTKQSRWKINKGNGTTTFFSPCLAHVAVHNTHPSNGQGLCCSAVLSIKDVAILSFTLYKLTHLGLQGATISFYLKDTSSILKGVSNARSFHPETDSPETLHKTKQKPTLYLCICFFWLLSWKVLTDTGLPSLLVSFTVWFVPQWSSHECSCEDVIMLLLLNLG